MTVEVQEEFVRGDVPPGPREAQLAWARALGNVCTVLDRHVRPSGAVDVAYAVVNADGTINGTRALSSATEAAFLREWRRLSDADELHERRAAFMAGEGTLTWREVVAWARELGHPCRPEVPLEMMPTDAMWVSVFPTNWPESWKPRPREA